MRRYWSALSSPLKKRRYSTYPHGKRPPYLKPTNSSCYRPVKRRGWRFASSRTVASVSLLQPTLSDPQRLIDAALEVAPFGAEAKLEFPSGFDYPSVDVYDPTLETYPVDDMVQTGQTLIDALRIRVSRTYNAKAALARPWVPRPYSIHEEERSPTPPVHTASTSTAL